MVPHDWAAFTLSVPHPPHTGLLPRASAFASPCAAPLPVLAMKVWIKCLFWKEAPPELPAPQPPPVPATQPTVPCLRCELPENSNCTCFLHIPQGQEQCQAQRWGALDSGEWNDGTELETLDEGLLEAASL